MINALLYLPETRLKNEKMTEPIHYVIAGHFAKDLVPGGGYQLGGAVFYSGVQGRRLGVDVSVISSAAADLDLSVLEPGMQAYVKPSPVSTTFENIYDGQGNRTQYVRGKALPLLPEEAPTLKTPPTLLQLGPLVGEVASDYGNAYPGAKLCVTPQGWMRTIHPDGRVTPKPWEDAEIVLPQAWAMVISEEDVGYDEREIERLATMCPVGICTRNYSGATLFYEGKRIHIPAYPSNPVDPTGAGDVFAASFFIRLYETDDPEAAVRFAHIAAARSIEGVGVSRVQTRNEVLALLD